MHTSSRRFFKRSATFFLVAYDCVFYGLRRRALATAISVSLDGDIVDGERGLGESQTGFPPKSILGDVDGVGDVVDVDDVDVVVLLLGLEESEA